MFYEENNPIQRNFDSQWKSQNLEKYIAACPKTEIFPLIEKYLKKGMKILESGCGSGKWVFYYHRLGYDITGLDWSRETVESLKKRDPKIKVICGDARKTEFKDMEFDLILSLGTVEHDFEGPQKALNEAYRILKKGGFLIITVPALSPARKVIYAIRRPVQILKSFLLGVRKGKISRPSVESFSVASRASISFTELTKEGFISSSTGFRQAFLENIFTKQDSG